MDLLNNKLQQAATYKWETSAVSKYLQFISKKRLDLKEQLYYDDVSRWIDRYIKSSFNLSLGDCSKSLLDFLQENISKDEGVVYAN